MTNEDTIDTEGIYNELSCIAGNLDIVLARQTPDTYGDELRDTLKGLNELMADMREAGMHRPAHEPSEGRPVKPHRSGGQPVAPAFRDERLHRIDKLMDAQPGTPEGTELDKLVDEQVNAEQGASRDASSGESGE